MNEAQTKYIASAVVGITVGAVVGHVVLNAVDKKLAKSTNPGLVNKFLRWNCRIGTSRTWTATVVVCNLASAVFVASLIGDKKYPRKHSLRDHKA